MGFTSNKDVLKLREQLLCGRLSSITSAQPPSLCVVLGRALLWLCIDNSKWWWTLTAGSSSLNTCNGMALEDGKFLVSSFVQHWAGLKDCLAHWLCAGCWCWARGRVAVSWACWRVSKEKSRNWSTSVNATYWTSSARAPGWNGYNCSRWLTMLWWQ